MPSGGGRVNEAGLDFYDRLVDGLLEAEIQPWATLYHWDLPQALHDRGGWSSRDTLAAFVDYADGAESRFCSFPLRPRGAADRSWAPGRTAWINQKIILGYYLGVDPERLAKWYGVGADPHVQRAC